MRSRSSRNATGLLVPIMGRAARLAALACAAFLAAPAAHASCGLPSDACAETSDFLGRAVARGDFNGDGFDDLAIGANQEGIGSIAAAGAVEVIYGTASGLGTSNRQFWSQNSANVEDVAENSTFSAPHWRQATSTATDSTTSPSASPKKTSSAKKTPGW